MFKSIVKPALLIGAVSFALGSNTAFASVFWVVETGDSAASNTDRDMLSIDPGPVSLDLYFDTEEATSFGWDLDLDVTGTLAMANAKLQNIEKVVRHFFDENSIAILRSHLHRN